MQKRDDYMKELAGQSYDQLVKSYASALLLLSHGNPRIRQAAIMECLYRWRKSLDEVFSNGCLTLATSDPDGHVRAMAVSALGSFYESSENPAISQFLAALITAEDSSKWLRHAAYLALRQVQVGLNAEDFARRVTLLEKEARETRPNGSRAEGLKGGIGIADVGVDCADEIDSEFVHRFLA